MQSASDHLAKRQRLTVFTNCIATALKLSGRNNNRVHLLGGEIQPQNQACLGRDATQMLASYFADFAIIGAGAISPRGTLMDFSREEAELHNLMLQSAQTVIVVADHQKFGRYAPVQVQSLDRVNYLVTDREPESEMAEALSPLARGSAHRRREQMTFAFNRRHRETSMKHQAIRREMIATCIYMNDKGVNQGTSGNISVRVEGGFLITPSGVPYHGDEAGRYRLHEA